jgi:shikimate kinase
VLSTGGGSVLHPLNRQRLRERGQVIYLHATPIQLFPRLRHDKKRPLLQVADPFQKLIELFDARDALYRETAHQVIPSGGRPSRWVLEQCLQLLDHPTHPKASA